MTDLSLPLFPLPNVVHFPRTDLDLHVFEPRYRRLVSDLQELPPCDRMIGMVVLAPGASTNQPAIFAAGTAGRMIAVEELDDGRSNIRLHGAFRFEVRSELESSLSQMAPYRRALVQPLDDTGIDERSGTVRAQRRRLMSTALGLAQELPDRFPFSLVELRELDREPLERLVNGLCSRLDLPVLRRLELLTLDLLERTDSLIRQLEGRRQTLSELRPYRHLAANPELN